MHILLGIFYSQFLRRKKLNIINVGGVEQFSLVDFPGKVSASLPQCRFADCWQGYAFYLG